MARSHRETIADWPGAVRDFRHVVELVLSTGPVNAGGVPTRELTLVLGRTPEAQSSACLRVQAEGVQNLRVHGIQAYDVLVLRLEDLRARGWDGLRFRVSEIDQNKRLSFDCESLSWSQV